MTKLNSVLLKSVPSPTSAASPLLGSALTSLILHSPMTPSPSSQATAAAAPSACLALIPLTIPSPSPCLLDPVQPSHRAQSPPPYLKLHPCNIPLVPYAFIYFYQSYTCSWLGVKWYGLQVLLPKTSCPPPQRQPLSTLCWFFGNLPLCCCFLIFQVSTVY